MKKTLRRLMTCFLAVTMMAGMCVTASAFKFPSSYWPLQDKWVAADSAQDLDGVIKAAQQTYDLLMPYGMNETVCSNLEFKCGKASWACEIKGDIDGAIMWLKRQLEIDHWIDANMQDYNDLILGNEARLDYLEAARDVKIYARSESDPSPYAVGPDNGTWYGIPAGSPFDGGSASLIYMEFADGYGAEYWVDYYSKTSEKFRRATEGGVIEFAWNFTPSTEGCRQVLAADSYIAQTVQALGKVDATILLRIGAEMNNWAECDPDVYVQAYRKIAAAARQYDNIQLVWSPDNINNRAVSLASFYPGDEYVDWVGLSTYHRTNYASYPGSNCASYSYTASGYLDNAYYGTGIYDYDPLVINKFIIELAAAHGKPVMISECGFSYWNGEQDTTEYAADQVNKFYSYVNMIYPQVKAVFYFDIGKEIAGENYHYGLKGSPAVKAAYDNAIAENGAYLETPDGSAVGWEELNQTKLKESGVLKLATYASFPGVKDAQVQYYVDGKLVHTANKAPYYYELDTAALGGGSHTIYTVASGNQFRRTSPTYTLNVPGTPAEEKPSGWAQGYVKEAVEAGIVPEELQGGYTQAATRGEFCALAVQLYETATGKTVTERVKFDDTTDENVEKAAALGVVSGVAPGKANPNGTITREQAAVMLAKLAEVCGKPLSAGESSFADGASISGWAAGAVEQVASNGIMSGTGGGNFSPKGRYTREQSITTMLSMFHYVK